LSILIVYGWPPWAEEGLKMTRKLKVTTAIALTVCALAATFAASASAEFHSSVEHTILDGKQVGSDSLIFNAGRISCSEITYSGTLSAKTSSTAELTPAYSECNAFGFVGVTIDVNGCKLVLHPATELTDISCGEKPIEVTAPNCTLTISSQTGLTSSTYSTEGTTPKRDVKVKLSLTGLKYTQTGKGEVPCTSATFSEGSYTAEATLTGTNTSSEQVDLWSEEAPKEFHSSVEHTTLDGSQVGSDSLLFNAGKISCSTITYGGTLSTKASSTVELTPTYSTCNAFGFSGVTIDVNGCKFVLHSSTELTDISCGAEKSIEVTASNCTLKISSQTGLTSSTYITQGRMPTRDIKAKLALTGLKYTQEGKGATPCTSSTFTDGSYTAEATLTGTNTSGEQVDLWSEDIPPTGRFHSSVEHTTFDGEQSGEDMPTFKIGTYKCSSIVYSATQTIKTPAQIPLTPTYSGCSNSLLGAVTITVNGCQWIFEAPESGGEPNKLEIYCPSSPIEITFGKACLVTVGSQNLTSGITYTTEGTTPKRDVKIDFNLSGLKYTQHSKTFPGCTAGTFTDGKWVGAATVKGTDTSVNQIDLWYE
jgi:hypothetical protein